jgi:hypothetical protein
MNNSSHIFKRIQKYIDKYINKYRLLIIQTNSYKNEKYLKTKEKYVKYKYDFHKYNVKLVTIKNKNYDFNIYLIGYDGKLKKTYKQINKNSILKNIKSMPMGKIESNLKEKQSNKKLSLYENYHPKTTIKGLGFKDEKTAINTIKVIKNKPLTYQKNVINTMYYRAKYHPNQTENMRKAMKLFKKWLKNN